MEVRDIVLRNATYGAMVELGRAPTPSEVATTLDMTVGEVDAGWRRLHDAHALVLDESGGIAMLNPFAARPTPFVVQAAGRSWFGNCGWDAFGIGAALHVDSEIRTTCPDCAEPIPITVRGEQPLDPSPVFHVLVPAVKWWDNIGFT
jgi:Alkylmercury lyase